MVSNLYGVIEWLDSVMQTFSCTFSTWVAHQDANFTLNTLTHILVKKTYSLVLDLKVFVPFCK